MLLSGQHKGQISRRAAPREITPPRGAANHTQWGAWGQGLLSMVRMVHRDAPGAVQLLNE